MNLHILDIPHSDIANKNYNKVQAAIREFERTGASFVRQSVYITFGGYDQIPDEIFEIKEAREYIQELIRRFPYIFYYLNFQLDMHAHVLGCLGDIMVAHTGEPTLTIDEYLRKGVNPIVDMPRKNVHITISGKLFKYIENGLYEYGKKIKDIQGANKAIKILDSAFNIQ